jgi:HEAT repeat protein
MTSALRLLRRAASVLAVPLALSLAAGCRSERSAPAAEVAKREIQDLVVALTPPPATAIPVVKSEHHVNRKRTLERMRQASPEHGLAALRLYHAEAPSLPEVRAGLLDVAAHTNPAACEELLVQLVTQFGEDLFLRRQATELLGECLPERAVAVLEPILRERYDDRTYPPEEQMLAAWITAMEELGRDPVPFLVLVATDLQRPMDVRHLATKSLGRHRSEQGRQALETLLVESTGNGYIRVLALQSLRETLPTADFCALARRIQEREADPMFIDLLQDALDKNCR